MRKISKTFTLMLTLIIAMSSLIILSIPMGLAQTGTNVSGIINQNTTWTKASSPYQLTGNITVNSETTLMIEAGTHIDLKTYTIHVFGTLIAKGNSTNKIHFNGFNNPSSYQIIFNQSSTTWNELTNTGCIIEDSVIDVASILIGNASPKINHNSIGGANICDRVGTVIYIDGGSAIISNNTITPSFKYCAIEIMGGSPNVCNNLITNPHSVYSGIIVHGNNYACVYSNSIIGSETNRFAIGIRVTKGSPTIERNNLENNIVGLEIMGDTQINVIFQNNTITKNEVGINFGKNFASSSIIKFNNIELGESTWAGPRLVDLDNGFFGESYTINAVDNWWGTTDAEAINKTVNNALVNLAWNSVASVSATVIPILTAPNPQALPEAYDHPQAIPYPSPYPTAFPSQITTQTNSPLPTSIESPTSTPSFFTSTPTSTSDGYPSIPFLLLTNAISLIVIASLLAVIIALLLLMRHQKNRNST